MPIRVPEAASKFKIKVYGGLVSSLFLWMIWRPAVLSGQTPALEPLWPTSASHLISSSFCEYRSGHFHAGIDIKTRGREGFPVYAIGAGYVTRIRVSPYGYGKAVYVKLDDGHVIVYAHLQKFSDAIETRVVRKQNAAGRYAVNFWLTPGEIPVTRGQVLAYTGSTGIGAPHLHFETRDAQNRPVNPFSLGYRIVDTIKPIATAVSAVPLDADSRVQGDVLPRVFGLIYRGHGRYQMADTLHAFGSVGLGVDSYDQADGAANKFAIYQAALNIDGQEVFRSRYDRFDYAETGQIYLERDYELMQQGLGRFQKLYRDAGNTLDFYDSQNIDAGILKKQSAELQGSECALSVGVHDFQIVLVDYFGNRAIISGILDWSPEINVFKNSLMMDASAFEIQWLRGMMRLFMMLQDDGQRPRALRIYSDEKLLHTCIPEKRGANAWLACIPAAVLPHGGQTLRFEMVNGSGQVIMQHEEKMTLCHTELSELLISKSGQCRVFVPAGSGREAMSISLEEKDVLSDSAVPVFTFNPNDVLLNRAVQFTITPVIPLTPRHGVYRVGRNNRLSWVNHKRKGGDFHFNMKFPASVTVAEDSLPPQIKSVFPRNGQVITQRRPAIRVRFEDALSGIADEDQYQFFLDGKRLLVAYDPESKTGSGLIRDNLSAGKHRLKLRIRDRAGNESQKVVHFTVQ